MTQLIIVLLLTAAGHYLLARAQVTKWLWSRYPKWLDTWASCAACSSTWIGAGLAWLFNSQWHWTFEPLPHHPLAICIITGLIATISTPLIIWLHTHALIGTHIEQESNITCINCGAKLPTPLPAFCPNCGKLLR